MFVAHKRIEWSSPGPTVQNLIGPLVLALELPQGLHRCLARRMYDTFHTSIVSEQSENPECFPTCPAQSPNNVVLDVGQGNQSSDLALLSTGFHNASSSSRSSVSSTVSTSWAFLAAAQPTTLSAGSHRSPSPSAWSASASLGSPSTRSHSPELFPSLFAPFSSSYTPSVSHVFISHSS
jgi:hypothetical protein